MGTLVAAYFVYNIRANDFFLGGQSHFESTASPWAMDTKAYCQCLYRVEWDNDASYDKYLNGAD